MKQNISTSSLFKPAKLRALLSFGIKGYLTEIGWFNAFNTKSPVDENGNPIPWVTYSFIDFIKTRIKPNHLIFEFGSGNSTYFYAKTASKVISVEHDRAWFEKISKSKPANSEMIFCELDKGGSYCKMPLTRSEKFHLIIVDGRDRVNCCLQAVNALTEDGVLILDDSEREFYNPAIEFLKLKGFKELSFSGISPGLFYKKSTTVFYKTQNCLDI
ncbi:FkbM family methyltransferase [Daejeonella oryzae]|uniref:FkbM family methyltransferase n=1 Tax=Daejeonella oryzae TaxID=1122943 RepID=UPI000429AB11|nr:FkbM family methyltransferase [Daejeonella oryzae]